MQHVPVMVTRTYLPNGHVSSFDILENFEFKQLYGHCSIRSFPRCISSLIEKWNKQQPTTWHYQLDTNQTKEGVAA